MSVTFSISCKDEIAFPAVSKPFDVVIENFDRDFKELFDDADKLQTFVQAQVDEKFAAITANSRDRDHARAANPQVSVEQGNVAVLSLSVTWRSNDDDANVTTVSETWKVNLKTKEVVASSSTQQRETTSPNTAATTTTTTSVPSSQKQQAQTETQQQKAVTSTSSSVAPQNQTQTQQQQQQQQPAAPPKKEVLPTAALGPASPDTPNEPSAPQEEEKKGGGCVIQ